MKKLDRVVTNNIKNKYQCNDAIEYDPKFGSKNPLPVVTVSFLGDKKQRMDTISILTCLWDSRATDIIIIRQHYKPYEQKMRSNNF